MRIPNKTIILTFITILLCSKKDNKICVNKNKNLGNYFQKEKNINYDSNSNNNDRQILIEKRENDEKNAQNRGDIPFFVFCFRFYQANAQETA